MVIRCGKCGGPVSIPYAGMVATCSYCHHPNQAPGDIPFRPPQFQGPVVPRRGSPVGCIVGVLMAVIALGAAGASIFASRAGFTAGFFSGIDPAARPSMGTTPLRTTGHTTLANPGTVVGEHAATNFASECRGYVPSAAHLALDVVGYQYVSLTTASSTDLTMVLRDPDGHVHCDDDSGEGQNPRITTLLTPGRWTVWIGTFRENAHATFTLLLEAQGSTVRPDATGLAPDATPTGGVLDLDRTPTGTSITDQVTGMIDGATLAPQCRGWFTPAPQLAVTSSQAIGVDLYPSTHTSTIVAVRSPQGVFQCTQGSGRVPTILAPGRSGIWLGTSAAGHPTAVSLGVVPAGSAPPPEPMLATPLLTPNAPPALGAVDLDILQTPRTLTGSVLGTIDNHGSQAHCVGYLSPQPTLVLNSTTTRRVRIFAQSPIDTVLMVQSGPGSTFCDDDSGGSSNPLLDITLNPGTTQVWVGTYRVNTSASFSLLIENLAATAPTGRTHNRK